MRSRHAVETPSPSATAPAGRRPPGAPMAEGWAATRMGTTHQPWWSRWDRLRTVRPRGLCDGPHEQGASQASSPWWWACRAGRLLGTAPGGCRPVQRARGRSAVREWSLVRPARNPTTERPR